MADMELITINDIDYFNASELHKNDRKFFYGCANNTRNIINKKKIDKNDISWGYKKNGEWIVSKKSYARAKLLLKTEWVYDNVPMFAKNNKAKYEIDPAPDLLELDDNEKLTDCDGNIMEIETRGYRDVDRCYFRAKDVGKCFEMRDIENILIKKSSSYEINIHYNFFTLQKNDMKTKIKKVLYLTYDGLIKCLYVSRNNNMNKFQKWVSKTLFTVQMGTKEQKDDLVSKVLGVSAKAVNEVFKTSSTTIPCIYLFSLNTVGKLRKKMNIHKKYSDDSIVCKYGFTKDLSRRTQEHMKEFGKLKKVNLKLKHHSYIDPQYISNAESDIKDFFEALDVKLDYDNHEELVIIKPTLLKTIDVQYRQLGSAYAGHVKELIERVEDFKKDMKLKENIHKNEMLVKDNYINMLKKDLEIERMRNKLLQTKNGMQ